MKRIAISLTLTATALFANVTEHEKALVQNILKSTTIEKVRKSPISGFYETYLPNGQLLYVNPFTELIFFGEIYTAGGKNLTTSPRSSWKGELTKKKLEDVSLNAVKEVSLSVGFNGGNEDYTIVMFTDPQCPYCIKAEKFLRTKKASIEYVYFVAMKNHRMAPKMIETILSSKEPRLAIESYVDGKTIKDISSPEAKEQAKRMEAFAISNRIKGTPNFMVFDKSGKAVEFIEGANLEKLSNYVK
ncbi:MAG: DsbC family protein [Campylobacterota bacterium]|nr:DsbC family protein [Campylobacterota bacterium]